MSALYHKEITWSPVHFFIASKIILISFKAQLPVVPERISDLMSPFPLIQSHDQRLSGHHYYTPAGFRLVYLRTYQCLLLNPP